MADPEATPGRPDPLERLGPVTRPAAEVIAAGLAGLSAMRRRQAVHPRGAIHAAEFRVLPGPAVPPIRLFADGEPRPAIVRVSRSVGLPESLPDLLGLAVRIPDAYGPGRHQDLLAITSVDVPVLHHGFVPARDVWSRPYSSALPYRVAGASRLIGFRPHPPATDPEGTTALERLHRVTREGALHLDLVLARPFRTFGPPVAELVIGIRQAPAPAGITFNPWNTADDLLPATWLNAARAIAYPRSQAAWRRTRSG